MPSIITLTSYFMHFVCRILCVILTMLSIICSSFQLSTFGRKVSLPFVMHFSCRTSSSILSMQYSPSMQDSQSNRSSRSLNFQVPNQRPMSSSRSSSNNNNGGTAHFDRREHRFGRQTSNSNGRVQTETYEDKNYENDPEIVKTLKRGQEVDLEVLRFGRVGATVRINGHQQVSGIVYQESIQDYEQGEDCKVNVGDHLKGSISFIRPDNKINIILRSSMVNRQLNLKSSILKSLEESKNASLPIGDKSAVEDIQYFFPSASKKDFKSTLGLLYKEGRVKPSDHMIRIMTEEERQVSKLKIDPKVNRLNEFTLFVGNLPDMEVEPLREAIAKVIAPAEMKDLRLVKGQDGKLKRIAFLQLDSKDAMEAAFRQLKGHEISDRKVRVDYATNDAHNQPKPRSEESTRTFGTKKTWDSR